jgi:hypothetical protein
MNALSVALLGFALAVGSLNSQPSPKPAQPPAKKEQPPAKKGQPPPDAKLVVPVEIVVGEKTALDKMCLNGAAPTTVFVVSAKQVYHCLGKNLHDHNEHIKNPNDMGPTIVRVSTGQYIRWFSKASQFSVVSVLKDLKGQPQDKAAPDTPFAAFPKQPASEVLSSPVPELKGDVRQRYKTSFNIQGVGLVDPDLICSM